MKTYIFTATERAEQRKLIIEMVGKDNHRKMVLRKYQLRNIERRMKP
jgi:hypothetical protein